MVHMAYKGTALFTGGFAQPGSRSWYADDLSRVIHPTLKSYQDAKKHCDQHREDQIHGVYLRHEKGQNIRVKIGKGEVKFRNEVSKIGRDHTSASEQPLENDCFIPCVDSDASLALEDALHRFFGKLEGVHNSIVNRIKIVDPRWLKPGVNSEGSKGGQELFDFSDIWSERLKVFEQALSELLNTAQVNKQNFLNMARDPQITGSDLLAEWLINGGDMKDFFLLMKPRSGKNTTMLLGLSKFIKHLKQNKHEKKIIVDFIGLWPSAFEGAKNDINEYFYQDDVVIVGVDTYESNWQQTYEQYLNEDSVDCVVRFASLQSIDINTANEYNNDEEREGAEIGYEQEKYDFFLNNPAHLCVIDESDHGMRTQRSQDVLTAFGYPKRIWMSGTDLYAVRHEIVEGNHFLYDIFDEIKDVMEGKHHMPLMRKHSLIAKILPLEDLDPETMNQQEITRKIVALFDTNKIGKWKYNKITDRFEDSEGKEITFKKLGEVKRLWELVYFWEEQGVIAPEDKTHIFCCMPSVASCLALYNHIKRNEIECDHVPLTANTFSSANKIEQQVKDAMMGKRTIFLTVGRMLRGAKAPWNGVIRFDGYNDYKIGLQLELRGQNTKDKYFDVYDANMFRSDSMMFELVKSRGNGKKVDSEARKLFDLIPMTRKGEFDSHTVTWEECVASYQAGRITEGFKNSNNFDEKGLVASTHWLTGVNRNKDNKADHDAREGKLSSTTRQDTSPKGQTERPDHDELKDLKARARTISIMLPILMIANNMKYQEIDDLLNNTPQDILDIWLRQKCGVDGSKFSKADILQIFNQENINHQLGIVKKKWDSNQSIDWTEFNNAEQNDVTPTANEVINIIDRLKNFTKCDYIVEPSCGTGEFAVQLAIKNPKVKLYLCDHNEMNIKITTSRLNKLGFDNYEILLYNNNNEAAEELKGKLMDKRISFDAFVGNPPYKGQAKLHQQFFNIAVDLVKSGGQVVFLQPAIEYFNKKEEKDGNHSDRMRKNIKKYQTSVEMVSPEIFGNAHPFNDLSITHLTKIEDAEELTDVKYRNGSAYKNVKLENVNKLEMEPSIYESIVKKYKDFVIRQGCFEDHATDDPQVKKFCISSLRGNITLGDWYTFIPKPDKDDWNKRHSNKGWGIPTQGNDDYAKTIQNNLLLNAMRFSLAIYKFAGDMHGGATRCVPFLFDKKYTDKEIYEQIGITEEEQQAIKNILPDYYGIY